MSSVVVVGFQVVVSGLGNTDEVPGNGGKGASVDDSDGTEAIVDTVSVDTGVSPDVPVATDVSVVVDGTTDSVETGPVVDIDAAGDSVETEVSVSSVDTSDGVFGGTSVRTGLSGEAVSDDTGDSDDVDSGDSVVT